jgi:DNA polymerase I-like protein with 3'-5' exonuclease and polymerase domains/uracil-DNA glycosylase
LAVAEAPGQTEVEQGTPLVGASGSWLRGREMEPGKRSGGLYRAAGVDQSTVSLCNIINCGVAADHKNVYPTDGDYLSKEDAAAAQAHCLRSHVEPLIAAGNWARIDILGDKALRALTGQTGGILRWRGSPLCLKGETKPRAIATLHPAFLARSQELMPAAVNDLRKSTAVPPEFYEPHASLETLRGFSASAFAVDIESDRASDRITMVGLSDRLYHAICVPFEGVFVEELRRIFAGARRIIGHNIISFDQPHLEAAGVAFPKDCEVLDTILMQHLLQPDLPHGLDFLGSFFTGKPAWKHLSGEDEELYCCRDVDVTFQCAQQLEPLLRYERLWDLYQNVSLPLARICHLMSETGFRVDPSRLKKVRTELEAKSLELEGLLPQELRTQQVPIRKRVVAPIGTVSVKTGKPLKYIMTDATEELTPWKSTQVLQKYFYEEKKLPVQTHAKTGQPSVDKSCLPKLIRRADPETQRAIRAIGQLRQIASLTGTFVKDEWNGIERIHSRFNPFGTASGRLSSSDINLQNIPISARYIYVPSYTDWVIISSDFSSLENRLTALLANDAERLERLAQKGFSEHKHNASTLFDIPYDEVVKDSAGDSPYTKAKKVTHGLNYGEGPLKIAKINDLPFAEVKALVEKWKAANPKTIAWQASTAAQAKKDGFLVTPFGRKRWFYSSSAHTESLSFLPQSSAADILIRCMIALMYERVGWPESRVQQLVQIYHPLPRPARLLATVHDSFVLECPLDMVDEVKAILERVLTQPWPQFGGYSFPIETGTGASWGEAK